MLDIYEPYANLIFLFLNQIRWQISFKCISQIILTPKRPIFHIIIHREKWNEFFIIHKWKNVSKEPKKKKNLVSNWNETEQMKWIKSYNIFVYYEKYVIKSYITFYLLATNNNKKYLCFFICLLILINNFTFSNCVEMILALDAIFFRILTTDEFACSCSSEMDVKRIFF